jgi:hypothetical protein
MKQLPDIVTSASFWASIATMWAAAGAWFTYVAATLTSRQQTHDGILSLIEGLEAEMELVSQWASGEEGSKGYTIKTRLQLIKDNPNWFNPSRMVFTFGTPLLNNVTNSPYARSLRPIMRHLVMLNHSIRRLLDSVESYQAFVLGDVVLYQRVLEKFAPKNAPPEVASSITPTNITTPLPGTIKWTPDEMRYINVIFMKNEGIHQNMIGGVDSADSHCLYKEFRSARQALQAFKKGLKTNEPPLPWWFVVLHIIASGLTALGIWEVLRWFGLWRVLHSMC